MIRTQIQLTDEQATTLKRLAAERHESVAELIRRGVEILLRSISSVGPDERRRRAIAVAGRFRSGRTDLSTQHDRHLAEAYGK
ncbi:MAG: ribbon-helix-helix protein, CopG family [Candidatus Neomarinimicrobiota bacterium]